MTMNRKRAIAQAAALSREYERGFEAGVAALAEHFNSAKQQNFMLRSEVQRLQQIIQEKSLCF